MKRHLAYLKYVLRHKYYVYKAGRTLGLGRWHMLIHDLSKFGPSEWNAYVHTFYKADGTKQDYRETENFKAAWNHHQKVNKHHWQYWVLLWDRGDVEPLPMPEIYVREMVADWVGAGMAIHGKMEVKSWFGKQKEMLLHGDTYAEVVRLIDTHFAGVESGN